MLSDFHRSAQQQQKIISKLVKKNYCSFSAFFVVSINECFSNLISSRFFSSFSSTNADTIHYPPPPNFLARFLFGTARLFFNEFSPRHYFVPAKNVYWNWHAYFISAGMTLKSVQHKVLIDNNGVCSSVVLR